MNEMTKEELEIEIATLTNNIDVLAALVHETNKPRKILAELTSKLLSLIRVGGEDIPSEELISEAKLYPRGGYTSGCYRLPNTDY